MKVIFNYATRQFEPMEPTLRDRFMLGGRVDFSKGGFAELTRLLNLLPDGTEVTRDMVQKLIDDNNLDVTVRNYFARPSKDLKGGITLSKRMSPVKITDDLLETIDNYIKNTPLNLKQIGEDLGYKPTKKGQSGQLRSTSPLIKEYEAKYGKIPEGRFKPFKLTEGSDYVKKVINLREKLGSTNAVANELGLDNKTIRNVLSQFRPDLMGDVNVPGPDTGAKAQKKRRLLKEKEGTKQLSESEKLFNKEQEKIVKDLNNDFKKNPNKVFNNPKLINLLNLKLEKGNIVSKNKTKKQILESINRQGGLLDIEHIEDIATGKKNVQFPVNRQITTYNVNSGFLRSVANYVNRPDADPDKIANIEKTLKEYGLRVKTNKGIIGAEMIGAKDNVKRNLDAAGIKYDDVVKPPQSLTKKGLKFAAKQIPLASFLIGAADAAEAFKKGVRNPLDLYTAYEVSPEVALKQKEIREDPTGKLLKEEIANLPEITTDDQIAGALMDSFPNQSFLQYQSAVDDGFQGSFEEYLQLQSMKMARGGRVGFANGSPSPLESEATIDQALASLNSSEVRKQFLYDTSPIGELDKNIFGKDGDRNLAQQFNTQFLDPRSYPYYAQKVLRGAANIPEFILSTPKAGFAFIRDLKENAGITKGGVEEILEILDPSITRDILNGQFGDLLGISDKAIQASEEKRSGPQRTTGDILQLAGELPGPATPFFLIGYAPKLLKQLRDLGVTGTAVDKINKEIENKVAQQGVDQTRRDILLSIGAGAGVGLLKYLGLDFLSKAPKAVKAAPEIVTKGGTPKYFFDFVNLIKSKGKDITDKAATLERQKVYDYNGYELTEDISTGKINIRKDTEGGGSYPIGDGEYETVEGIVRQEEINYNPSETIINDKGKSVDVPDNYSEDTARVGYDGELDDVSVGLDSIDEILQLLSKDGKKYSLKELEEMGINLEGIGDNVLLKILKDPTELKIDKIRTKGDKEMDKIRERITGRSDKAGGGIMKMAGDDSGPPPKSGPTPDGLPYIAKNVRPIKERK
jgi:hypothetical protein